MSIKNLVGQSPFLTSNKLHTYQSANIPQHLQNHYSKGYSHHYSDYNSSSNHNSYENKYYNNNRMKNDMYFPKQFIKILPGTTNLCPIQQQKIIHPLNNYPHNVQNKKILPCSPFHRGQLYHEKSNTQINQSKYIETNKQFNSNYLKDNPFHKKYLLSQKNQQLMSYAMTSSDEKAIFSKQFDRKKYRQFQKNQISKFLKPQEMGQGMLRLAKKYGSLSVQSNKVIKIQDRGQIFSSKYIKDASSNQSKQNYYNPKDYRQIQVQYQKQRQRNKYKQYTQLVQSVSQIDQRQFDSFGKGNQQNENSAHQGQSIINGLTDIVRSDQKKNIIIQKLEHIQKRKPIYFDSDDDSRKSGTFRIPDSLIDEINNPKIIQNKGTIKSFYLKETDKVKNLNSSYEVLQKIKYQKNQKLKNTFHTKEYPEKINKKGIIFQKIPIC